MVNIVCVAALVIIAQLCQSATDTYIQVLDSESVYSDHLNLYLTCRGRSYYLHCKTALKARAVRIQFETNSMQNGIHKGGGSEVRGISPSPTAV